MVVPRLSPGLPTRQMALILGAQNSKSLFLNALSVIPIGVLIRESIGTSSGQVTQTDQHD
jgi:hypothetical protein